MSNLAFCPIGNHSGSRNKGIGKIMTVLKNQTREKNDYDYLIPKREGSSNITIKYLKNNDEE